MKFFVRAVVTGFALSLGAALFKKIQDRIGLGEKAKDEEKDKEKKSDSELARQDAATDPSLQTS
jgi:hypothetical protein